jgi:hypothetical protein
MLIHAPIFTALTKCLKSADMKEPPHPWAYTLFYNDKAQHMVISDAQYGCVVVRQEGENAPLPTMDSFLRLHAERILEASPEAALAKGYTDVVFKAEHVLEGGGGLPQSIYNAVNSATNPMLLYSNRLENFAHMYSKERDLLLNLDWDVAAAHEPSLRFIYSALDRVEKAKSPKRGKNYTAPSMYITRVRTEELEAVGQQYLCFQYGIATGVLLCRLKLATEETS